MNAATMGTRKTQIAARVQGVSDNADRGTDTRSVCRSHWRRHGLQEVEIHPEEWYFNTQTGLLVRIDETYLMTIGRWTVSSCPLLSAHRPRQVRS
jgi:methionine aminopeptidase